eukprot:CAMPEP_0171525020 /NCGR_PEP_ID=MMETSP0959-20130129/9433_1 /TAXON_ID=87120 /ORGANISM="Aurantiochytrium limacinum, Strain ATCCMYA-1381" /LENGTH=277 /DNA_ID=CAMNT_0012065941 /DNA_START=700 /DNA_END=1529 /DNA_ORIENTATION=-
MGGALAKSSSSERSRRGSDSSDDPAECLRPSSPKRILRDRKLRLGMRSKSEMPSASLSSSSSLLMTAAGASSQTNKSRTNEEEPSYRRVRKTPSRARRILRRATSGQKPRRSSTPEKSSFSQILRQNSVSTAFSVDMRYEDEDYDFDPYPYQHHVVSTSTTSNNNSNNNQIYEDEKYRETHCGSPQSCCCGYLGRDQEMSDFGHLDIDIDYPLEEEENSDGPSRSERRLMNSRTANRPRRFTARTQSEGGSFVGPKNYASMSWNEFKHMPVPDELAP